MNLEDSRQNYSKAQLDIQDALEDPLKQFEKWFQEATEAQLAAEANAMVLSTIGKNNRPSARIVLLKSVDSGFVFYTNYESRKGENLIHNPYASLTFFWAELERQVRIEGKVEKVRPDKSTQYFNSRPIKSQMSAIASPQSKVLETRSELEQHLKSIEKVYEETGFIERPQNWGGYRLIPDYVEFWQGRESRLHDRIAYLYEEKGEEKYHSLWKRVRLAP